METKIKCSVITVCKNSENIAETCKSVLSQTFKNFEWIVIDGASAPETLEILEKYREKMAVFISEEDTGTYNAMNKGIACSRGEWLIFMNGGDAFADPFVLENIFSGNNEDGADLLCGNTKIINPQTFKVIREWNAPRRVNLKLFATGSISHQATFIKKSLFDEFGGYNETMKIAADYEKWLVFLIHGKKFKRIRRTICHFSAGGISEKDKQLDACERALAHEVVPFPQRKILNSAKEPLITVYRGKIFGVLELFKIKQTRTGKKKKYYIFGIPVLRIETR